MAENLVEFARIFFFDLWKFKLSLIYGSKMLWVPFLRENIDIHTCDKFQRGVGEIFMSFQGGL